MADNRYIEKMGGPLGTQFYALWQEVVWLHMKWAEVIELFGSNPRIELLNKTAPAFFEMIQNVLWEDTLLHIARLTDVSKSGVGNQKANLTIQNLPQLVSDPKARQVVVAPVETAVTKASFARDWRNRHIAHRDLDLALNTSATPLETASRKQVDEALTAIADVLNILEGHYMDSSTHFIGRHGIGDAASLLHFLDEGIRAEAARSARLCRGEYSEEDHPRRI